MAFGFNPLQGFSGNAGPRQSPTPFVFGQNNSLVGGPGGFGNPPQLNQPRNTPTNQGQGTNAFGQGLPTPGGSLPSTPAPLIRTAQGGTGENNLQQSTGFGDPSQYESGVLNAGAQPNSIPGTIPNEAMRDRFLPDVFREPFLDGLRAAGTTASFSGQALPGAGQFQAGLYSPTLNPMEQAFMQSSAYLGNLGLEQAMNNINNQYSTTPFSSSKNKMYADAANQFAAQMMNTGSKLALDRQQLATQNLPNVFGFPLQAAQVGQESSAGFYNALEKGMYGDLDLPFSFWSSYPIQGSTYIQPAQDSGGK